MDTIFIVAYRVGVYLALDFGESVCSYENGKVVVRTKKNGTPVTATDRIIRDMVLLWRKTSTAYPGKFSSLNVWHTNTLQVSYKVMDSLFNKNDVNIDYSINEYDKVPANYFNVILSDLELTVLRGCVDIRSVWNQPKEWDILENIYDKARGMLGVYKDMGCTSVAIREVNGLIKSYMHKPDKTVYEEVALVRDINEVKVTTHRILLLNYLPELLSILEEVTYPVKGVYFSVTRKYEEILACLVDGEFYLVFI